MQKLTIRVTDIFSVSIHLAGRGNHGLRRHQPRSRGREFNLPSQSSLLCRCACKMAARQRPQMTTGDLPRRLPHSASRAEPWPPCPASLPSPLSHLPGQSLASRIGKVGPVEDVRGDAGRAADALVRLAAGGRAPQGLGAVPQHHHIGAAPGGGGGGGGGRGGGGGVKPG